MIINLLEEKLLEELEENHYQLKYLAENIGKEKFVVASDDYINVGPGLGLNDTEFTPRCPPACVIAQIFDSEEEATKNGMDYHLINGRGEKIIPKVIPAKQFFKEEMIIAERLIKMIKTEKK